QTATSTTSTTRTATSTSTRTATRTATVTATRTSSYTATSTPTRTPTPGLVIYPNPVTSGEDLKLRISSSSPIKLSAHAYNLRGAHVAVMADSVTIDAGIEVNLSLKVRLARGVYVLVLRLGTQTRFFTFAVIH